MSRIDPMRRWLPWALLLFATSAVAQGLPPFELNDPGEAFQLVEMDLAIHDTELLGNEIDIRTDDRASAARDQGGAGAESGSLRILPGALGLCFADPGNPAIGFCTAALDSEGTRAFYEIRNPPGSSNHGGIPGISTLGELIYESSCGDGCNWLEGGIESKATSGFDLPAGTLDLTTSVETPDYGVNLEFSSLGSFQHRIFARSIASLNDWIYVTGPASTATVTLVVSIDATVEAPDAIANSEEYWITQGYGDLRESGFNPGGGLFGLMPATVYQMANLQVFAELTDWSFEPVCEPIDEEGNEICTDEWVPEVIADATALREREMLLQYEVLETETTTEMLSFDTGPLPPSLTVQATAPTGRWVEVRLSVSSDTECKGAKNCDLDVYTNAPVQLSITSPGATLVAWHGIAGLTRVPEPGAGLSIAAALAALVHLRTRRGRQGDTVTILRVAIATLLAPAIAAAQGAPPFEITPAHSDQQAWLSINIEDPQAFQVDLEAFGSATGANEQEEPSDGGRVLIATAINDIDSFCGDYSNPKHNFAVLYWDSPFDSSDPIPAASDRSDFSQEMFYDVNGTGCAAPPDAPLYAIASSSHDLGAGTIDVRAHAATNAYGYDSVAVGPISTIGYGHFAQAQATAHLADWIYVTGPNPTATVVLVASFDADFDSVPMPANDSDWFSEAFDEDIRLVAPCGGEYERPDFSGDAQRPEGTESSQIALNLSLRDNFVSEVVCYEPPEGDLVCTTEWSSTSHGETVFKSDAVIFEWVDGEAPDDADCSDDVLEAVREEEGALSGSASVQVEVATNQWIQVRTSLHVESSCDTPLLCDLGNSTGGPTHLSISSPDGTLVSWHGIAGLTRVPEPGSVPSIAVALAAIARMRSRRR